MIFVESPDPVGRKLLPPWIGPFRLTERLSSVGFLASPEGSLGGVARVHVNRLRKYPEYAVETQDPRDGLYPDSRRMLRMIQGHQQVEKAVGTHDLQLKKRAVRRRGYTWVSEQDLPTVVVKAYLRGSKGRPHDRGPHSALRAITLASPRQPHPPRAAFENAQRRLDSEGAECYGSL
jgi:hypothetical protein